MLFESNRLVYNRFLNSDSALYRLLTSNQDVMRMITEKPLSASESEAAFGKILSFNDSENFIGYYKIALKTDGLFAGLAKFVPDTNGEAEIGYMLLPDFWHQGFGTEICRFLIDLARQINGIRNLNAIIDPENFASKAILKKCGFNLRSSGFYDGLPGEEYMLSLF